MNLLNIKRNQIVRLVIPAAAPIKTLSGDLFEAGQDFKVLGTWGTCVRLSRVSDHAKLIINAEVLQPAPLKLQGRMVACDPTLD